LSPPPEPDRSLEEVSPPLRAALLVAGVAVLYSALVLLAFPDRSAQLFAWNIQPPVTAAFMGALYSTGVPLMFLLGRRGTPWIQVRPVIPSLIVLSSTMLLATMIHSDRFIWSNVITWFWTGLYSLYPPVLLLLYARHARRVPSDPPVTVAVVRGLRVLLIGMAAVTGGLGLGFFIAPEAVNPVWPWKLSPLTTRVVGGWLLFLAAALGAMARERDWMAIRLMVPEAALIQLLLLFGVARFRESIHWDSPSGWVYLIALVVGLVMMISVFLVNESRLKKSLASCVRHSRAGGARIPSPSGET
jgi:hypothetical protein